MSVRLYLDHNVPGAVAEGLHARGVDVLTAQDDGRASASDEQLLERATALDRVLFSHDTDFLRIAAAHQRSQRPFSGVVWVHPDTLSIGELIDQLEFVAQLGDPDEYSQRVLYLPL